MRILMLNPILGEAFGTERVMRDSSALLRKAGHQVFWLGEELRGSVADCDGYLLIEGIKDSGLLTNPIKARRLRNEALVHDH